MDTSLAIFLGVVVGAFIGWLLRTVKAKPADTRVEDELRQQRAAQDGELLRVRNELATVSSARVAAETALAGAERTLAELKETHKTAASASLQVEEKLERELLVLQKLQQEVSSEKFALEAHLAAERKNMGSVQSENQSLKAALERLREELLGVKKRNGELESEVTFLKERLTTERQQIERIQEKFNKEFEGISNKLLLESSTRFNQQSSESLDKLLNPLKETLGEFRTSLESTRTETAAHSFLLKEQIARVGAEAANLSKALKGDVKVLGNWGENMLDQILEKSGLQRDLHYRRQQSAKNSEGEQRFLDVIVELPENRNLIIDSKVSLRSYEEAVNCLEDGTRAECLIRHADAIRAHVRNLGGKRYQDLHGINSPDLVLLYIPIEGAFFAAVGQQPALFGEALEQNVVLITNSTLLAALRTVAHVWRLADQQKHAIEIAERGGRLYDKFVGFVQDLEKVGKSIRESEEAWSAATNKLHIGAGNLVRQAEQLKALGVKASRAIPAAILDKALEEDAAAAPPQNSETISNGQGGQV